MYDILNTYNLGELKKMISNTNIKGYSKLKKDELIKLMIKEENIDKFKNIKPKKNKQTSKQAKQVKPKEAPKPKPEPKPETKPKEQAKQIEPKKQDEIIKVLRKKINVKSWYDNYLYGDMKEYAISFNEFKDIVKKDRFFSDKFLARLINDEYTKPKNEKTKLARNNDAQEVIGDLVTTKDLFKLAYPVQVNKEYTLKLPEIKRLYSRIGENLGQISVTKFSVIERVNKLEYLNKDKILKEFNFDKNEEQKNELGETLLILPNKSQLNQINKLRWKNNRKQFKNDEEARKQYELNKSQRTRRSSSKSKASMDKEIKDEEQVTEKEALENIQKLRYTQLKEFLGKDKIEGLKKIFDSKAQSKKVIHIMALIRFFFPNSFIAEMIKKYGVKKMFEKLESFVKKNSNKEVFIPTDQGNIEGKGIPLRTIVNPIYDYLPYRIINGKVYKTRQEADARLKK